MQSTVATQQAVLDSLRVAQQTEMARYADSVRHATQRSAHEVLDSALSRASELSSISAAWMGVFIGALGVLFTIGAITTAFLLWRQSADYRQQREKLLRDAEAEIARALADRNTVFDEWQASVERRAEALTSGEARREAGGAGQTAVSMSQIQRELDALRSEIGTLRRLDSTRPGTAAAAKEATSKHGELLIYGPGEDDVGQAVREIAESSLRLLRWEVRMLPDERVLVRTSFRADSKGFSELVTALHRRFPDATIDFYSRDEPY